VNLQYKPDQAASLFCSFLVRPENTATILGTSGSLRVETPFWCPDKITHTKTDGSTQVFDFPLPKPKPEHTWNFCNSIGLQFQANYVHHQLKSGKLESEILGLNETLTIMSTLDEIRKQLGVKYPSEQ